MFLQACLNGSRPPGDHDRLPLTPDELARGDAERRLECVRGWTELRPTASRSTSARSGYDHTTWAVLDAAVRRGREARIGFEDTYGLPDARRAGSNAELVAAAAERYLSSSG